MDERRVTPPEGHKVVYQSQPGDQLHFDVIDSEDGVERVPGYFITRPVSGDNGSERD